MFELRCTVRHCQHVLFRDGECLACHSGHRFDRAKQGYWSLLQPQDRRSKHPGDSAEAVLARQRWLAHGHMSGLIDTIKAWIEPIESPRTLELGCGEGSIGAALFGQQPDGYCGIDLSKQAIKLASRRWPAATWVLANADRFLPANDGSVDRVVSLFGRRPKNEIVRVLNPTGVCIVAVPGTDDLIQLRQQVQETAQRRSRWELTAQQLTEAGLRLIDHQRWKKEVQLNPEAIADALAMTYRGARHSQRARVQGLTAMEVTLDADLILLGR